MHKDVLGKHELEALKLNWDLAGPGLMGGRCLATGTCDNRPSSIIREKQQKSVQIVLASDATNIEEIKLQYGYLRF